MKKLYLIMLLGLSSCSLFHEKEERFVNPLFYETLSCISQDYEIHLSPKKITSTAHAPFDEMTCSLLKNESTEIVLSCSILGKEPYTQLFRYILTDSYHYKGCRIVGQYTRFPSESKWINYRGFCLHSH